MSRLIACLWTIQAQEIITLLEEAGGLVRVCSAGAKAAILNSLEPIPKETPDTQVISVYSSEEQQQVSLGSVGWVHSCGLSGIVEGMQ